MLVGVDGGGTKTDCVAMDASTHQVVGRAVGGASNWYVVDGGALKDTFLGYTVQSLINPTGDCPPFRNSTGKDTALKSLKGSIAGTQRRLGTCATFFVFNNGEPNDVGILLRCRCAGSGWLGGQCSSRCLCGHVRRGQTCRRGHGQGFPASLAASRGGPQACMCC